MSDSKNFSADSAPKKKKGRFGTLLRTVLLIISVLLVLTLLLYSAYSIDTNQPVIWKSGEMSIGYTDLTVPCEIEKFERLFIVDLHPNPNDPYFTEEVFVARCGRMIKLRLGYCGDYITSIGTTDPLVEFPGGISVGSDEKDALREYNTYPLNSYRHKSTSYWGDKTSEFCRTTIEYRYFDHDSYEIYFNTDDGKITSVKYYLYNTDLLESESESE